MSDHLSKHEPYPPHPLATTHHATTTPTLTRTRYDGSISHSPRHTFKIGKLEPDECSQCLDAVYTADKSAPCLLDGGKARHCGRDEYVAYMRRVTEHGQMRVHEHAKVVDIKRNTSTGRFSVHANHRSEQGEMLQLQHSADAVVLAFGAASKPKPFHLDPGTIDGAQVSSHLETASKYTGRNVLVIGTGPSGMESAVRLCSSTYGAKHVTLASHSRALYHPFNDYVNQSLYRIRQFTKEGLMSLHLGVEMRRANATHAVLARTAKRGVEGIANEVTVAADLIIGALGFTTDAALVDAIGFGKNGSLDDATHETSIPGIFNLGVSGVAPWESARIKGKLGTFIEDTQGKVQQVCRGVLRRLGVSVKTEKDRAKDSSWCAEQPLWHEGVCAALGKHQQDADCKLSSDGFWANVESGDNCFEQCQACQNAAFCSWSAKDNSCQWHSTCEKFPHLITRYRWGHCTRIVGEGLGR